MKKQFKRLKGEFDELVNAADMVGFNDEVSTVYKQFAKDK